MENARNLEMEPPVDKPPAATLPSPVPMRKKPLYAGVLACFPGIGNIYNGLYLRGVIFFSLVASLLAVGADAEGDHPVLGFAIAFVWIFNVIDSVRQAKLINHGYAQDLGLEDLPKIPKAGQGGLLAGILFLVLGVVASLEVFFKVDLSWVLGYWPLAPLFLGGGLVYAWFRDRRRRDAEV